MAWSDKVIVEGRFPVSEQNYTIVKLFDGTECQIPLRHWS